MSDKAKELAEYQGSIAAAITAYRDAAMRFAEGHSTLKEHELIPARRHLEKLIDATVPLGMYERVRRERDFAAAELTRLAEENARMRREMDSWKGSPVHNPPLGFRHLHMGGEPPPGIAWMNQSGEYFCYVPMAALGAKDKGE